MNLSNVKIVTFVPIKNANIVRKSIGDAGAGKIGKYSYCSFSVFGKGRFKPIDGANPTIGQPNIYEAVKEERIEVVCNRSDAKTVIAAIKKSHPYEEVGIDIYPMISELDL